MYYVKIRKHQPATSIETGKTRSAKPTRKVEVMRFASLNAAQQAAGILADSEILR